MLDLFREIEGMVLRSVQGESEFIRDDAWQKFEDWVYFEYGEDLLLKRGNWNRQSCEELMARLAKDLRDIRKLIEGRDDEKTVLNPNGRGDAEAPRQGSTKEVHGPQ